jgi:hypothetical protein
LRVYKDSDWRVAFALKDLVTHFRVPAEPSNFKILGYMN